MKNRPTIAEIQSKYPNPGVRAPRQFDYCVLGAACLLTEARLRKDMRDKTGSCDAHKIDTWPLSELAADILEITPEEAIDVMSANDHGHYGRAWGLLAQAFDRRDHE